VSTLSKVVNYIISTYEISMKTEQFIIPVSVRKQIYGMEYDSICIKIFFQTIVFYKDLEHSIFTKVKLEREYEIVLFVYNL
jgi:hypothetical protein